MINKKLYIQFIIIICFVILATSCEKNVDENIFEAKSTIWVNAIIGTEDSVKIYLGNTSGMNSGELAQFRNDATVQLFINNSSSPNLLKFSSGNDSKGYYYYPRLASVKPGDSLFFKAWIEGSDFKEIEGKTKFPFPVLINSLKAESLSNIFNDRRKIDLKVVLDSSGTDVDDLYFEMLIRNSIFDEKDIFPGSPSKTEYLSILNNLELPYGMVWNERLNSIFIDYSKLGGQDMNVSFEISDNSFRNNIEVELRTISGEYYEYCRAIENGFTGLSNIKNGSGIFAGYSRSSKIVTIK